MTITNPALERLSVLIGNWTTTGTHGMLPGTTLHGRASIEWLENAAFMIMRSEIDDQRFPRTVAIIASDDATGEYYLLTFDDRGVSRKYDMSFTDRTWRWWRNAPGFSQRYSASISEDGRTMVGKGELSKDGATWKPDLDLTYQRAD